MSVIRNMKFDSNPSQTGSSISPESSVTHSTTGTSQTFTTGPYTGNATSTISGTGYSTSAWQSPKMVKKVKGTVRFRCQGCHKEYDGTDAYNAGWKCSCGCPIAADVEISIVEEPEYQMWTYTVPTNCDYSVTVSTDAGETEDEEDVLMFRCRECGGEFGTADDVLPTRCPFCPSGQLELI
jgi:hypothetical protein